MVERKKAKINKGESFINKKIITTKMKNAEARWIEQVMRSIDNIIPAAVPCCLAERIMARIAAEQFHGISHRRVSRKFDEPTGTIGNNGLGEVKCLVQK